ncbi:hypothetical protein CHARACLAT_016639 [Characodon lateralis]|uniref:Phosphatidylinositol-specific phospholipase C X domain-containing protein n=1 Tax=Characodon lateralis TaxID=208331 RepID=A0ABU7EAP7_9TELE|nr:hypothetical protein [Characodon lateralis]
MAQYLIEILGEKLDVSSVKADESGRLPSPESLRGKILVKGKKLPPNIDENAEEGDVSDEDSADEMEDDCKLMNGDVRTLLGVFWSVSCRHCVPVLSRLDINVGKGFQFVVVHVRIKQGCSPGLLCSFVFLFGLISCSPLFFFVLSSFSEHKVEGIVSKTSYFVISVMSHRLSSCLLNLVVGPKTLHKLFGSQTEPFRHIKPIEANFILIFISIPETF